MKRYTSTLTLFLVLSLSCAKTEKPEGTVVARVNGQSVTLEEIEYQFPPEYRARLGPRELQEAIDNWINTEVLYQKAVKEGLDKQKDMKAVIKFGIREAVARRFLASQLSRSVSILPKEVDSIYAAMKDSFRLGEERLRASHILVATREEAEAIYQRLEKGEDFATLAQDYSLDRQSGKVGGDIGYFTPGQIDPAFAQAARKLQIGKHSRPVKTRYGYHIILLKERQKRGAALDSIEAKRRIFEDLYSTRHARAFDSLLEELKREAVVETYPIPSTSIPGVDSGGEP